MYKDGVCVVFYYEIFLLNDGGSCVVLKSLFFIRNYSCENVALYARAMNKLFLKYITWSMFARFDSKSNLIFYITIPRHE